jgi:hypothetical protein
MRNPLVPEHGSQLSEWNDHDATREHKFGFCALDLTCDLHAEIRQPSAAGNVKFRMHQFTPEDSRVLLFAAGLPVENRADAHAILQHLDLGIYERVSRGVDPADPSAWIAWLRRVEAEHGAPGPLNSWIGLWDLDTGCLDWAGDGLAASMLIAGDRNTPPAFYEAWGASRGTWQIPPGREALLFLGALSTVIETDEIPEVRAPVNSSAFSAMEMLGASSGQLLVSLRQAPERHGTWALTEVSSIGAMMRHVIAQAGNLGWSKPGCRELILKLGAEVMRHCEWDVSLKCKEPVRVEWKTNARQVSYQFFKNNAPCAVGSISPELETTAQVSIPA